MAYDGREVSNGVLDARIGGGDDVMEKAESKQAAPIQQSNESSAKTNVFKRHFQLEDTGVYVVDVTRERDAYQAPKWICDRLEVLAQSR